MAFRGCHMASRSVPCAACRRPSHTALSRGAGCCVALGTSPRHPSEQRNNACRTRFRGAGAAPAANYGLPVPQEADSWRRRRSRAAGRTPVANLVPVLAGPCPSGSEKVSDAQPTNSPWLLFRIRLLQQCPDLFDAAAIAAQMNDCVAVRTHGAQIANRVNLISATAF